MNDPLVSILVPVYNSGKYLENCLNSLLRQELSSFEILCVNDGSTDFSPRILEDYAKIYPEIQVIHQKNAGVSAARNRALALARGKYVCFCDSDDVLLTGFLRQAVDQMEAAQAQLCFYESRRCSADDRGWEPALNNCPVTRGLDDRILKNLYVFRFLISRDFLTENSLAFREELSYSEDELFVLDLLRMAEPERIVHLHGTGYLHRKNPDSVMRAPQWYRAPRHYVAMRIFAGELRQRSAREASVQEELIRRRYQAASNALYDGFFLEKPPKQILAELTADGLYPYPLRWDTLKPGTFKTTVSNAVRFLFPIRGYYLLVCGILRNCWKFYKKGMN